MKKIYIIVTALSPLALMANGGGCSDGDPAASRQAAATTAAMNNADRTIGMPRIVNFSQRKLLKNAYEDMDQTILTWVYTQGIDGRFVCMGQALGYGVSMGTSFTAPEYPKYIYGAGQNDPASGTYMIGQPEPNGLYTPPSGDATIVDLVDPATGQAHTAMVEPKVLTVPFKLPATVVSVPCPTAVDPDKVVDAKEATTHQQR